MRLRLVTKQLKSQSLKQLALALSSTLGYKVWRSSKPKPKQNNLFYGDCQDKITQYQWFQTNNIPSVPFTTSQSEASSWVADGQTVMARCLTRASEGRGIVVLDQTVPWVVAPVYTWYLKKKREFRVHCYKDQVVAVLEKRRKVNYTGDKSDTKIRNTANGYVFCSADVAEPKGIRDLALAARRVTASDFAGVDIGYNEKLNQLFVIEVNSAPGIQGSNIDKYVASILNAKKVITNA